MISPEIVGLTLTNTDAVYVVLFWTMPYVAVVFINWITGSVK